MCNP